MRINASAWYFPAATALGALLVSTSLQAETPSPDSPTKPILIDGNFSLVSKQNTLGAHIFATGDINADGINDFAIALPQTNAFIPKKAVKAGSVLVYSGVDQTLIKRFDGLTAKEQFGFAAIGNVDLNGDCIADLVIAAPFANKKSGRVDIIYGSATELQRQVLQQGSGGEQLGYRLASGEKKLKPLIYAAAPTAHNGKLKQAGKVYRLSTDNSPVPLLQGERSKFKLGSQLQAFGNLLAVTQYHTVNKQSQVMVYRNEQLLQRFDEQQPKSGFGESIAFGSNVLGTSIAIGAPKAKRDGTIRGAVMSVQSLGKTELTSAAVQWQYSPDVGGAFGKSLAFIDEYLFVSAPTATNQSNTAKLNNVGKLYQIHQTSMTSVLTGQQPNLQLGNNIAVSDWQGDDKADIAIFNAGSKKTASGWQFINPL